MLPVREQLVQVKTGCFSTLMRKKIIAGRGGFRVAQIEKHGRQHLLKHKQDFFYICVTAGCPKMYFNYCTLPTYCLHSQLHTNNVTAAADAFQK